MSQSDAGNIYLPFRELMRLETIDQSTFRSTAKPFSPGGTHPRAHGVTYGGHVYAQAAWAAAQTVGKGFVLHDITGFFILGGISTVPFVYNVTTIRDGKSYCTRTVNVTQSEAKGICFTCTCSFKLEERNDIDVHEKVDLWDKYKIVLQGKKPDEFEEAPGMDLPWYWKWSKENGFNDKFPGLQTFKVNMDDYNKGMDPLDQRQLHFYRVMGDLPDEPNLHLAAHLYASDRNSLFIVANHFGVGDSYSQMGSLAHTVIFHSPIEQMLFNKAPSAKYGDWFCKEDWTTRIAAGRGMFHSRVWNPHGTHISTLMQDGMIRLGGKAKQDSGKL